MRTYLEDQIRANERLLEAIESLGPCDWSDRAVSKTREVIHHLTSLRTIMAELEKPKPVVEALRPYRR